MELKLKPEVKVKYLARLRSGTDGQCTSKLADGEGNFCCLGVLSQIAVEEGVIPTPSLEEDGNGDSWLRYADSTQVLPFRVAAWAFENLNTPEDVGAWDNPGVDSPFPQERRTSLATLNDDGYTFPEIADVIEEQL